MIPVAVIGRNAFSLGLKTTPSSLGRQQFAWIFRPTLSRFGMADVWLQTCFTFPLSTSPGEVDCICTIFPTSAFLNHTFHWAFHLGVPVAPDIVAAKNVLSQTALVNDLHNGFFMEWTIILLSLLLRHSHPTAYRTFRWGQARTATHRTVQHLWSSVQVAGAPKPGTLV